MINSKELLNYTKDLNLLFAEDHLELRISTTEILKNFFKKVDAVSDGEKALKLYKQNSYDIVLTDIRMPYMDGVTLTEKIYRINPNQAIIILSAHDEATYLIPLINLGVSQFIQKPLDFQELLESLYKISKAIKTQEHNKLSQNTIVNFNDKYCYDRSKRILLNAQTPVYLTKYEIIFLDLLTSQNKKIFSNQDIVTYYLQHNENIDPQNIRKLVSKLRKKVPTNSIESIYGVGYRVLSKS